jgi:histidine phosphotransferase ChpT
MSQTSILAERAPQVPDGKPDGNTSAMTGGLDLTSVLVSRICHDLVSPVGAIVNGVDLVREIGGGDIEAELAMISQSSNRASALLQYYRIAFGAASDDSEISRNALREQANAFLASPRILLNWPTDNGPYLTRPLAKLLLQVLLCARGLAAMRGMINVQLPQTESLPLEVIVESDGGPESAEMLTLLKGGTSGDAPSPRLVEFALTRTTAEGFGLAMQVTEEPGRTSIRIT